MQNNYNKLCCFITLKQNWSGVSTTGISAEHSSDLFNLTTAQTAEGPKKNSFPKKCRAQWKTSKIEGHFCFIGLENKFQYWLVFGRKCWQLHCSATPVWNHSIILCDWNSILSVLSFIFQQSSDLYVLLWIYAISSQKLFIKKNMVNDKNDNKRFNWVE